MVSNLQYALISFLVLLFGALLLLGEWLCVEIAWRCMDYRGWIINLALTFILSGLILVLISLGIYRRNRH